MWSFEAELSLATYALVYYDDTSPHVAIWCNFLSLESVLYKVTVCAIAVLEGYALVSLHTAFDSCEAQICKAAD